MSQAGRSRRALRCIRRACTAFSMLVLPWASHAQTSSPSAATEGIIGATAQVMPSATFEGGAERTLSIPVVPGNAARVEPADGVQTRVIYSMSTRVTVTATTFVGPGGALLDARLLCAQGEDGSAVAAAAFDCNAGYVARLRGSALASRAIGVGATVDAAASARVPAGVYTGVVTLVATQAGF